MLKAVTFDFWMTLYRDSKRALERRGRARRRLFDDFLARLGCTASDSEKREAWDFAAQAFHDLWHRHHRPLSTQDRIALVLERLNVSCSRDQLRRVARAYEDCSLIGPPVPLPGVRRTVPLLAREFRLAIVCDTGITTGRVLRTFLEHDGLLPHFRHLVFSDEVGSTKPHVDNFRLALRRLRARPEEAVHIGDLIRTDILGARRAGMHAILFTGVTQYPRAQLRREARGVPVVQSFGRIPESIRSLARRIGSDGNRPEPGR